MFGDFSFSWASNESETDKTKLNEYANDVIQIYWLGYIEFLKDIEGKEKAFEQFIKNSLLKLPVVDKMRFSTYDFKISEKALTSKNCEEFLKTFTGFYALSVLTHENPKIKTTLRIRALKLFNQIDPNAKCFLSISSYRLKDTFTNEGTLKNPLPLTLDPNQIEDQERRVGCICNLDIFGGKKSWDTPVLETLRFLENNHKQELVQMVCTFLFYQFPDGNATKIYLNKLFELSNLEGDIVGLIFGEHASYRNKGKVTLIMDDVSHMGTDLLQETVRSQRTESEKHKKEIKELKKHIEMLSNQNQLYLQTLNSVSHEKIERQSQVLLANLQADISGYFNIFGLNPFLAYESYIIYLKPLYKKLTQKYHPDRAPNEEDKVKNRRITQDLLNAYNVLSKKESFDAYKKACLKKAKEMASQQK